MAFDKISVAQLYQKRAENYDISANLYYLIGIREFAYRKMAVDAQMGGENVKKKGGTEKELARGKMLGKQ